MTNLSSPAYEFQMFLVLSYSGNQIVLEYMKHIFNEEQQDKAAFICSNPLARISELYQSEVKELAVVWSFYSGKIEGNSYNYVEAETLLKDGITSLRKYEDALMLCNLYDTFLSEVELINKARKQEAINEATLLRLHHSITKGLVPEKETGAIRTHAVRIHGTKHVPSQDPQKNERGIKHILISQGEYTNPLEKAVYLHCNLARLHPFIDGNKRTARMMESIVLMNADIIPVYSSKDVDIMNYKKGVIAFYETKDYRTYSDYFLDRQIERIKELED